MWILKIKHRLLEERYMIQSEYMDALERGNTFRIYVLRGQLKEIERVLRWVTDDH